MFLPSSAKGDFRPNSRASPRLRGAFTLIELLVATAVFMLLVVVLASISNQALQTWSRNENKSDLRESARSAINLMGSELRQAVLPVYRGDQSNLQFVVNPAIDTAVLNRDAIFWQAPLATDRSKGDLAIVGYFVRRDAGGVGKLCRLFVNPVDPDYNIYTAQNGWVDSLLNKASPTETNNLQGLFLENVPGMWVTVYTNGTTSVGTNSYDSRVAKALPSRVEITLALMDKKGALRVADGVTPPVAGNYTNAVAYLNALPPSLRPHVEAVTINVGFK